MYIASLYIYIYILYILLFYSTYGCICLEIYDCGADGRVVTHSLTYSVVCTAVDWAVKRKSQPIIIRVASSTCFVQRPTPIMRKKQGALK